ncbi:MAG TPA: hypothetical protein VKR53_16095 [Puia sp.]|nr:hypothetical protein [Puia sp.]
MRKSKNTRLDSHNLTKLVLLISQAAIERPEQAFSVTQENVPASAVIAFFLGY